MKCKKNDHCKRVYLTICKLKNTTSIKSKLLNRNCTHRNLRYNKFTDIQKTFQLNTIQRINKIMARMAQHPIIKLKEEKAVSLKGVSEQTCCCPCCGPG